jgi:hypothetical protein
MLLACKNKVLDCWLLENTRAPPFKSPHLCEHIQAEDHSANRTFFVASACADVAKCKSFVHSFSVIQILFKERETKMEILKGLSWWRNWETWWKPLSRKWKKMGGTVAMKARLMIIVRKSLCEENLNLMRWRNPPPCPPNCLCRNRSPRCLLPGLIGIDIFVLPLPPYLSPSYMHTFLSFFFIFWDNCTVGPCGMP